MKIILMPVGICGDVEPFPAIGETMKEKGHQVFCLRRIFIKDNLNPDPEFTANTAVQASGPPISSISASYVVL